MKDIIFKKIKKLTFRSKTVSQKERYFKDKSNWIMKPLQNSFKRIKMIDIKRYPPWNICKLSPVKYKMNDF